MNNIYIYDISFEFSRSSLLDLGLSQGCLHVARDRLGGHAIADGRRSPR